MSLLSRVALAHEMVTAAGEMIRVALAAPDLAVSSKGPGDVVTETDFAVERLLRHRIAEAFPDDAVIGEEMGGAPAMVGCTWLIDPVDGTVNFARRLNYFCVSLALLENGEPVGAWILDPQASELFSAGPDGIARLNGNPVAAAKVSDLADTVAGLGFSTRHRQTLQAEVVGALTAAGAEHRRLGAGALCLAHVAAGRLDAYLEPHMNPWDAVGGLYLARCAGAVTGVYADLVNGGVVYAAAPSISSKLLALLPEPFSGTPLHRENEPRSAGDLRSDRAPIPNQETRQ